MLQEVLQTGGGGGSQRKYGSDTLPTAYATYGTIKSVELGFKPSLVVVNAFVSGDNAFILSTYKDGNSSSKSHYGSTVTVADYLHIEIEDNGFNIRNNWGGQASGVTFDYIAVE